MSPSTAETDRTTRAQRYQSLQSLREYVLVAQPERHVVVHRRQGERWSIEEYGEADRVRLSCGLELEVARLYPD